MISPDLVRPAFILKAPTMITSVRPRLSSRFIAGLVNVIVIPAFVSFFTTSWFTSWKRSFSYAVLDSAFMTRMPAMFSRTVRTSLSIDRWDSENNGRPFFEMR